MKKICLAAILLLTVMVIAFIGFSKPEPTFPVPTEAVELPPLSGARAAAEEKGREALEAYIAARLAMEELAKSKEKEPPQLAPLTQKTKKQWHNVQIKATTLKEAVSSEGQTKVSLHFSLLRQASASMPLDRKKEEALTKERQRIIAAYADYPYSSRLHLLAEQIEHDAALALELLNQAEEDTITYPEASQKLRENCQISITAPSLGGRLKFARAESHEAFAWFWDENETFVTIAPEGTHLLLGKVPQLIFLPGDTEIILGCPPS